METIRIRQQEADRADAESAHGDAVQSDLFLEGTTPAAAGQPADSFGSLPESGDLQEAGDAFLSLG